MQPHQTARVIFPADFSQVYALGYHELCTYIESFLDDDLTQAELSDHYRHQINQHLQRLDAMCNDSAQAIRAHLSSAREV